MNKKDATQSYLEAAGLTPAAFQDIRQDFLRLMALSKSDSRAAQIRALVRQLVALELEEAEARAFAVLALFLAQERKRS